MDLSMLNQKQQQAVTAPLGPVLVLAGAGSGKTKVLTFRIAYIIEQGWFKPEQILAVTFTNKAAVEMQNRIVALLGSGSKPNIHKPTLGTFHAIGVRILRKYISKLGYSANFVIADSEDQLKIIKDILKELDTPKQFTANLIRSYISGAKNLLQTPANLELGLDGYLAELVGQVYMKYQNFLLKQNTVDFDDLLMLPYKLFENFPEVLRYFQNQWRYILVDEYQDTNQAQYMFLQLLAKSSNIFVVGDDAQSIYGFRGSNIANILNFENDFPQSLVVKLEQNYRSTQNILSVAQKVIELNHEQKPKTLWTTNQAGEKVIVEELEDGRLEARYVAYKIISLATNMPTEIEYEEEPPQTNSILDKYLAKQKYSSMFGGASPYGSIKQLPLVHNDLKEFAVLYRTHAQSRQLEEVFIEAGIPYHIVGGVKFYERKEIKDVLAYLRLLINPLDYSAIRRVVNLPPRGIGDRSLEIIRKFVIAQKFDLSIAEVVTIIPQMSLPAKASYSVVAFYKSLLQATIVPQEATLSEVLKVMIKLSGLEEFYRDGTEQGDIRVENIRELFNVTSKFDHLAWREGLILFLEEVALIADADSHLDEKNSVTLMTLHAAKGLEFDTVFFVGLEEGFLPHSNSLLDPKDLAEEIRLAYVGMTRARNRLFLLYAQQRQVYGGVQANAPSRILKILPKDIIKFKGNISALESAGNDYTYEPF